MKRTKDILVIIILLAIAARVIWWSLEPLFPLLLVGLVLFLIISSIVRKQKTW